MCCFSSAKIIRERWKFWSGHVPTHVNVSSIDNNGMNRFVKRMCSSQIRLQQLETRLSMRTVSSWNRSTHDVNSRQICSIDTTRCSLNDEYRSEQIRPKDTMSDVAVSMMNSVIVSVLIIECRLLADKSTNIDGSCTCTILVLSLDGSHAKHLSGCDRLLAVCFLFTR
jgi:hypothetical protein